ncbi:MAG: 3'-5' exonuclease [Bacteroidetes bacterium]|nr:MAG: 3'-5' exonuclease [Bacteroidota bacterium]
MTYYLVLDLELSGTEVGWHEIIQIGAVLFDQQWNELGQFLDDVCPENEESFSSSAEKVHGLSWGELQDAPMIYDLLPEFEDWVIEKIGLRNPSLQERENALRRVIICGQSVINDINFLRHAYNKEKLKWNFSNVLIDLHTLFFYYEEILRANKRETAKGRSLGKIASFFGYHREDTLHNALEDSILTAKCLKHIIEAAKDLKFQ